MTCLEQKYVSHCHAQWAQILNRPKSHADKCVSLAVLFAQSQRR